MQSALLLQLVTSAGRHYPIPIDINPLPSQRKLLQLHMEKDRSTCRKGVSRPQFPRRSLVDAHQHPCACSGCLNVGVPALQETAGLSRDGLPMPALQ
jgi:hypothetical protein